MGELAALAGKTIYLDTNIFIYAVEEMEPYKAAITELFANIDQGRITAFTKGPVDDWQFYLAAKLLRHALDRLLKCSDTGRPFGGGAFIDQIENALDRQLGPAKRGRRKNQETIDSVYEAKFASASIFAVNLRLVMDNSG